METNVKKLSIALFSVIILMGACKKENLSPMMNANAVPGKSEQMNSFDKTMVPDKMEPEELIVNKKWKMVAFNHDGQKGKLDYYKDFIFKFSKYDYVLASKKDGSVNGKWNYLSDKPEKAMVIDFGKQPFIELNSHWKIKEISAQKLTMYDDKDGMLSFVAADEAMESPKEK